MRFQEQLWCFRYRGFLTRASLKGSQQPSGRLLAHGVVLFVTMPFVRRESTFARVLLGTTRQDLVTRLIAAGFLIALLVSWSRWPLLAIALVSFAATYIVGRIVRRVFRDRGRFSMRDHIEPGDLPTVDAFLPSTAAADARLVIATDLHVRPYFYLPKAFAAHPVFASQITRVERIPHRYLHAFLAYTRGDSVGFGCSFDIQDALHASIYEAMERLFSTFYDPKDLVVGSARDLAPESIDVASLVLMRDWEYERASYPYVRYSENLPLHWLRCHQVTPPPLRPRLIPATMAIRRYSFHHPDERFVPGLSAGTASDSSYAAALLNGVYELVERDAFVIAWLNRLSCPRVVPDHVMEETAHSVEELAADGFSVTFVDLTTDLKIPVILTAIKHTDPAMRPDGPIIFGLGAHLDPRQALEKSHREALGLMINFYDFSRSEKMIPKRRRARGLMLSLGEYFDRCAFLSRSPDEVGLASMPNGASHDIARDLDTCLAGLARAGSDVYFADFTPRGMLDSAGYSLVRAFASYLQPHLYEFDVWRLANPRLSAVRGDEADKSTAGGDELNLLPNPFAVYDALV